MSRARCLFWVQSLLGSGHLRRALLVAEESLAAARLMDGADLRLRRLAAWVSARWRGRSGRAQ